MKRIGISFIVLLSIVSCSWVDTKTKEDIDNKVKGAKAAIVKAGEDQVKNAQARIENAILTSVTKANHNIDSLVKASIAQIEKATDEKVQQAIDNEIKELESDIKNSSIAALIGIVVGLIGLVCAVLSMLKLRENRFREEVVFHVTESRRVKEYISKFIEDRKPQAKTAGVSQEEVRTIVKKFITDPKILEYIAKQIDKPATPVQVVNTPTQNVEQPVAKVDSQPVQRFELYARDSTTRVLSDIFPSHQKGKTIYKLIMDSPSSTTAILDLCVDKEDAVGRILRFNDEDIESVCTVSRKSDRPEKVRVLKTGKAEQVANSQWNVTEKIDIELS
ncbi:MAG: hypothetical protein J6U70_07840 [Bacteroidales bacterium]|nr:hypothetical protein [Bacteroidales bacterium]